MCGRRDLMRRAHKKEIGQIGLKGRTAVAFYAFVLKVRTHLYELHRLGEINPTDIIEDVCANIPQEEQDTWKRPLQGREEVRTCIWCRISGGILSTSNRHGVQSTLPFSLTWQCCGRLPAVPLTVPYHQSHLYEGKLRRRDYKQISKENNRT